MPSSILVTGGAGFIGHHLVRALLDQERKVVVLDNFSSSDASSLPDHPHLHLVEGDIRDTDTVDACLRQVDGVVHLAAMVSIQEAMENPSLAWDINVRASEYLLEAARQAGVKAFVFASSSAVYGDGGATPRRELDAVQPLSLYGAQKASIDALIQAYGHSFGMRAFALRFFNVFGPGQRAGGPYAALLAAYRELLRRGGPLTIFGDGTQSRDFVHVTDVVRGICLALNADAERSGAYNIGTGRPRTVQHVAELVAGMGSDIELQYLPPRPAEILHSCADCSHARARLGYEAVVDFEAGLRQLMLEQPSTVQPKVSL